MPSFKTHLNALLESFGLDYEHKQQIAMVHTNSGQQVTEFIPPCDGFLVCVTQEQCDQLFLENSTEGINVFSIKSNGSPTWLSDNAIVKKGNIYRCTVNWIYASSGNSRLIFYPFTYSMPKS